MHQTMQKVVHWPGQKTHGTAGLRLQSALGVPLTIHKHPHADLKGSTFECSVENMHFMHFSHTAFWCEPALAQCFKNAVITKEVIK